MENLEGDRPLVPDVLSQVDGGHATASELALERVAAGQGGLEPCQCLGQSDLSDWGVSRLQPRPRSGQTHRPTGRFCCSFSGQERAFWDGEAGTNAR